jgi:hypothetical protein
MTAPHVTVQRVRGRLVEIEVGEVAGIGWVAVGVVKEGLPHEEGMRFEATGATRGEAELRLSAKVEGYFA